MKDLDYGINVGGSANGSITPNMLTDGAVGVYGVVGGQATNNANQLALIVDHASTDTTGNYADTLFRANRAANPTFVVVQGTSVANGGLTSAEIPIDGIVSIKATEYAVPVKQITHIGYDADGAGGTAGAVLNTPTITAKQEALVKVTERTYLAGGRQPGLKQNFGPGTALIAAETDYNLMKKMVAGLKEKTGINVTAFITSATAGAAGTGSEDLAAVNGATTMTIGADPSWDVGDYIRVVGTANGHGDTYLCVTGTTTTTVVFDRPYTGVTETIDALTLFDLGTSTGELGLKIVNDNFLEVMSFAVAGALEDAVITYTTDPTRGSGSAEHVGRLEQDRRSTKGEYDQITSYYPTPSTHVVAAETYDLYFINYRTQSLVNENAFKTENELIVAFPEGASNGGQAEFEDVMGTILNGADGLGGLA